MSGRVNLYLLIILLRMLLCITMTLDINIITGLRSVGLIYDNPLLKLRVLNTCNYGTPLMLVFVSCIVIMCLNLQLNHHCLTNTANLCSPGFMLSDCYKYTLINCHFS